MKKRLSELFKALSGLGLPVGYRQWEEDNVPPLPYLIVYSTGKDPWYADNTNYFTREVVTIELYTDDKDEDTEALLESFFNARNITLSDVYETFWDDEHLHEVSYEFEII